MVHIGASDVAIWGRKFSLSETLLMLFGLLDLRWVGGGSFGSPFTIPKHAFFLWLAVRNSLSTGDRLLSWGYLGQTKCVFCRSFTECRDHLFLRVWIE
jgi:hypothetical protein